MLKFAKITIVAGVLATLTACTGHVDIKKDNSIIDYVTHPASSISKVIGGCGPAADL